MKKTKKSLLFSGLALMMSALLLAGTTFAWFTDSVTNKGNTITAGELDITATAYHLENGKWSDAVIEPGLQKNPLFVENKWEPGQYGAILLKVKNNDNASLTAKIDLEFTITNSSKNLENALWYNVQTFQSAYGSGGATALDMLRFKENRPASAADGVKTMSEIENESNELVIYPAVDHEQRYGYYLVEYGMYTSAGNEYQDGSIEVDFTVKATQATVEKDGFGSPNYDEDAGFAWSGEKDESGLKANTNDEAKTVSIDTPEQLAAFATAVNAGTSYQGYTITLQNNMDLGGKEWTPIGKAGKAFQGVFDGNGYTVSNLKISTPKVSDVGFFGYTANGEIRNLKFDNASVEGYLDVGVVAGTPYTSKYTDIEVTGTVQVKGFSYVGGMFGKNVYKGLSNLTLNVSDDSYVKADSVEGDTEYRTYVGGVIGFMGEGNIMVSNVTSNINVYGSTSDVGGITGIAHYGNTFENCSSSGNVYLLSAPAIEAGTEIGGIAGVWMNHASGVVTLRNCSFTGMLYATLGNGTDITDQISDNTLTGSKYYPNSNAGQLIIE